MLKKIFFLIVLVGCSSHAQSEKVLATSIAPFASLLKEMSSPFFSIVNIASNSSTAEDIDLSLYNTQQLAQAEYYFSFALPFEKIIEEKAILPTDHIIHLEKRVDILNFKATTQQIHLKGEQSTDHDHEGLDPHIWTSPKRMLSLLEGSLVYLQKLDPENKEKYRQNFKIIQARLQNLDQELLKTVQGLKNKSFLVFHPAFGYVAKDYGLEQIAIEHEGKETSLKEMNEIINLIKQKKIPVLFLQEGFDPAILDGIKQQTSIEILTINPLAPDYENQIQIFIKGLQKE